MCKLWYRYPSCLMFPTFSSKGNFSRVCVASIDHGIIKLFLHVMLQYKVCIKCVVSRCMMSAGIMVISIYRFAFTDY